MKRRSFLRLLGGAAAVTAAPNIVRAQTLGLGGGTAPSNRLTVGIIGCGGIHGGHRDFVLQEPGLQLVWLSDVDRSALERSAELLATTLPRALMRRACARTLSSRGL